MTIRGKAPNGGEKKLKILFCILYYLPHRTGMPIYIERIGRELIRRGHEVTVLAVRHQPHLPRVEVIDGMKVIRLASPPIPISRGMIMPAYPWAAYLLMRQHDVVSVSLPMLETPMLRVIAALTGRKLIATNHGDLLLPEGVVNQFIQKTMFAFYKFMMHGTEKLVMYSDDYAAHSYYAAPFRDKVQSIYPPIEIPEPDETRAAELRAQWSHNGGPVIGFAGRFVEEKRPDLLIRSLDIINAKYPNARIVFAGEYDIKYENTWEKYQPIVKRYRDQLIFLGMITDMQEMANFYAACDVLALTSDSECFALVQVEAMLCGTPVVMTNTPGGRVPVQVTGMGKLAEQGDVRSIGQAIVDILDDPETYVRSRKMIESCFSLQETVDQYEQLFYEYAAR